MRTHYPSHLPLLTNRTELQPFCVTRKSVVHEYLYPLLPGRALGHRFSDAVHTLQMYIIVAHSV